MIQVFSKGLETDDYVVFKRVGIVHKVAVFALPAVAVLKNTNAFQRRRKPAASTTFSA